MFSYELINESNYNCFCRFNRKAFAEAMKNTVRSTRVKPRVGTSLKSFDAIAWLPVRDTSKPATTGANSPRNATFSFSSNSKTISAKSISAKMFFSPNSSLSRTSIPPAERNGLPPDRRRHGRPHPRGRTPFRQFRRASRPGMSWRTPHALKTAPISTSATSSTQSPPRAEKPS